MNLFDFSKIRSKINRVKLSRSYKLGANLDTNNPRKLGPKIPHNSHKPGFVEFSTTLKRLFNNN